MSVTVVVGSLIAITGMYLSLTERTAHDSPKQDTPPKQDRDSETLGSTRWPVPGSIIFQSLIFIGLAILGLAHSATGELPVVSVLSPGTRGSVFYLGATLTLAGAIGVVLASTARSVALSAAILGTGGATVLGVAGSAITGGFLLAGAALCGWWLHAESRSRVDSTSSPPNGQTSQPSVMDRALNRDSNSIPEPLLTSVAIVLFCWVLGSTLQSAVEEGTGSNAAMRGSTRALPRPAFDASAKRNTTSSNENGNVNVTHSHSSSRDNALFWCATGLLAATIGLGYSRAEREEPVS
ncbi:MAG: hypothetical protein HQ518_03765 [Rhodopirellula sp.]|nr:hypothetical protein [Rhodopirellula sp.]